MGHLRKHEQTGKFALHFLGGTMKTFWNADAREELKRRLGQLSSSNNRQWGKMTCDEMLSHLVDSFRMTLGELKTEPKPGPLNRWPIKQLIIYWAPWPKGLGKIGIPSR
jgi:hypothetical protein